MHPTEQFGNRIGDSIFVAVMAIFCATFANAVSRTVEYDQVGMDVLLFGLSNFGILITLVGFGIVTFRAGLLGTFGYILELISTANIQNGELNVALLFIGALLVVVGDRIWSWMGFLRLVGGNQGGGLR